MNYRYTKLRVLVTSHFTPYEHCMNTHEHYELSLHEITSFSDKPFYTVWTLHEHAWTLYELSLHEMTSFCDKPFYTVWTLHEHAWTIYELSLHEITSFCDKPFYTVWTLHEHAWTLYKLSLCEITNFWQAKSCDYFIVFVRNLPKFVENTVFQAFITCKSQWFRNAFALIRIG